MSERILMNLRAHIAHMAPHQRQREAGQLLIEAERTISLLKHETGLACTHCGGGRVLELRVQADQKIYQPCLCAGNTVANIARESFKAGYKRAEDDAG